jgi:hypothetical protein
MLPQPHWPHSLLSQLVSQSSFEQQLFSTHFSDVTSTDKKDAVVRLLKPF